MPIGHLENQSFFFLETDIACQIMEVSVKKKINISHPNLVGYKVSFYLMFSDLR